MLLFRRRCGRRRRCRHRLRCRRCRHCRLKIVEILPQFLKPQTKIWIDVGVYGTNN